MSEEIFDEEEFEYSQYIGKECLACGDFIINATIPICNECLGIEHISLDVEEFSRQVNDLGK